MMIPDDNDEMENSEPYASPIAVDERRLYWRFFGQPSSIFFWLSATLIPSLKPECDGMNLKGTRLLRIAFKKFFGCDH